MASRLTAEQREQWRRVFALADRVDALDPWGWMSVADCFGVALPELPEPCFVIFGGQSRAFRHVRVLMGWKAFYDLVMRLAEPDRQVSSWLLEIRMIELLFVNDELLFDFERRLLKALRRPVSEAFATAVCRSIVPGYHPWLPDAKEAGWLEAALYQAYGMAMRVEADGMLLKARFPREVLVRRPDASGAWTDTWQPVEEMRDEEVEVRLEAGRLHQLRALPPQPVTLQVDLVFTPLKLNASGGRRPQTAYVLLVVDAESGFIVSGELVQATGGIAAMWAQLPERLLAVFGQLGGCPQAVEIQSDRMANLLRPLTEHLPFRMVRRERLAMLENAREHLSAYFQRE